MAQTQFAERLGNDSSIFGQNMKHSVPQSAFDLSRKHMLTCDAGMIVPVDWFKFVPGDRFKINVRYLLDTFPMVVPPMINYRVRTHWYACRYQDLWKGAETFLTKGRTGRINYSKPSMTLPVYNRDGDDNSPRFIGYGFDYNSGARDVYLNGPSSLMCYLTHNFRFYNDNADDNGIVRAHCLPYVVSLKHVDSGYIDFHLKENYSAPTGFTFEHPFNALIPFMYQKIYRDNYLPFNLIQDNKYWCPDDISNDDWRIDVNGSNIRAGTFFPIGSMPSSGPTSYVYGLHPRSQDVGIGLGCLRYAPFDIDQFTTARPFLTRGIEPTMNFNLTGLSASSEITYGNLLPTDLPNTMELSELFPEITSDNGAQVRQVKYSNTKGDVVYEPTGSRKNVMNLTNERNRRIRNNLGVTTTIVGSGRSSINANMLRNLMAFSVFAEINATTNGNYNSFVRAHFNINPRHPDYEPVYIGGTSDVINFGQVLQTSASTSDSKLGSVAGIGQVNSRGFVGSYVADDFGYIMGVMIITPETVYNQGISREWTNLTADDEYFPEFNGLGFQPMTKKELYWTGRSEFDNDLFGYQSRNYYLKTRPNVTSGLFSFGSNSDIGSSAFVGAREFKGSPNLNADFTIAGFNNIRKDAFAYPLEPMFRVQFVTDLEGTIRSLPFQSKPNTFGV